MVKTLEKEDSNKFELPNGYIRLAIDLADVALGPPPSDVHSDDIDKIDDNRHAIDSRARYTEQDLADLGIRFRKLKSSKNQQ